MNRHILDQQPPTAPGDWDGLSWCVNFDGRPATHRKLAGFDAAGVAIVEMVCCQCSHEVMA